VRTERRQPFDAKSFFVDIHQHNPHWVELFQQTRQHLLNSEAIRAHALDIHHVGSTAIPGLDAKPIIDILIDVSSMEAADSIVSHLQKVRYEHLPQKRDYDQRRFLRRYVDPHENDHVHLTTRERNPWRERLLRFRDSLLTHPETVRAYLELKHQLAQRYPHDRFTYGRAKDDFIQSIVEIPSVAHRG